MRVVAARLRVVGRYVCMYMYVCMHVGRWCTDSSGIIVGGVRLRTPALSAPETATTSILYYYNNIVESVTYRWPPYIYVYARRASVRQTLAVRQPVVLRAFPGGGDAAHPSTPSRFPIGRWRASPLRHVSVCTRTTPITRNASAVAALGATHDTAPGRPALLQWFFTSKRQLFSHKTYLSRWLIIIVQWNAASRHWLFHRLD